MPRLLAAAAVLSAAACWALPPEARTAEPAVPALVLRPAPECATATSCERPAQLTILLLNLSGFSTPESLQVSIEPRPARRSWTGATRGMDERRIRRARFRDLGTADRVGAAFEAVQAGEYDVRVGRLGLEAALWRVVLAPACWSRLEVLVEATAPPNAVAPSSATLYSCSAAPQASPTAGPEVPLR